MSPELDHIFIMTDADAPEAAALARIGLVEEPANVHPGQGTAGSKSTTRTRVPRD